MIKSMTGYGEAGCEFEGVSYIAEIKTVNNRYLKTNIKLPDNVAFLEEDIEKLLRQNIHRGTLAYTLRTKNFSSEAEFEIDTAAIKKYIEQLSELALSLDAESKINPADLLLLPGMIKPVVPDEEKADAIKGAILKLTSDALDHLSQMRIQEGKALEADLNQHCEIIKQKLELVRSRRSIVMQEYHDKLKKRVESLLAAAKLKLDEEVLAREVAIYADRADISEETARLDSHLDQFSKSCSQSEHPGRRLDFITQEMLREANTIASKSSDIQIVNSVVDIKCAIDRIKEQTQNIE